MVCLHDPSMECKFKQECSSCPLLEGIMRDYPH